MVVRKYELNRERHRTEARQEIRNYIYGRLERNAVLDI